MYGPHWDGLTHHLSLLRTLHSFFKFISRSRLPPIFQTTPLIVQVRADSSFYNREIQRKNKCPGRTAVPTASAPVFSRHSFHHLWVFMASLCHCWSQHTVLHTIKGRNTHSYQISFFHGCCQTIQQVMGFSHLRPKVFNVN